MSRLGHALIAPLLLALSLGALASGVDTYEFRHPERQTRAQELARALRCPQCQNQNLVESNSPIARDLRLEVYRWVDEGQSDEQVIDRMTERFGDFVRYDPPFKRSTALLWGGPALLLLLALNRLRRSLHRRQPARVPLVGDRAEGMLAHDPRAELNRLIMAEQQAGLAPHSRLYRELELARLANATPTAEQALRDRLVRNRTARPQLRQLARILLGALLLALMAGIYAGTGRYQAWQAYQSRPDPLAGLSLGICRTRSWGVCIRSFSAALPISTLGRRSASSISIGVNMTTPCSPTSVSLCWRGAPARRLKPRKHRALLSGGPAADSRGNPPAGECPQARCGGSERPDAACLRSLPAWPLQSGHCPVAATARWRAPSHQPGRADRGDPDGKHNGRVTP